MNKAARDALQEYIDARCEVDDPDVLLELADALAEALADVLGVAMADVLGVAVAGCHG
jgi:hypothetical protein